MSESKNTNKITCLTFNFAGLPLITKRYKKRLEALVDQVLNVQPDVLCIQEFWMKNARQSLVESLQNAGYHFCYLKPDWRFSGNFICSKYKIINSKILDLKPVRFSINLSLLELVGFKGCISCEISPNGKDKIVIINSHLQAHGKAVGASEVPNKSALDGLIEEVKKHDDKKIILAGDLNFEQDSEEYKYLVEKSGLRSVIPDYFVTTLKRLFSVPAKMPIDRRVDHILLKNFSPTTKISSKVIWDQEIKGIGNISDHAGLYLEISI